jgi:nitrogen regulatory protein PII-like uncharacterized protein
MVSEGKIENGEAVKEELIPKVYEAVFKGEIIPENAEEKIRELLKELLA